jgi:hypothetical protein
LNINGKIRPKINERGLIPAIVFLIGIFDLKITEIIRISRFYFNQLDNRG